MSPIVEYPYPRIGRITPPLLPEVHLLPQDAPQTIQDQAMSIC